MRNSANRPSDTIQQISFEKYHTKKTRGKKHIQSRCGSCRLRSAVLQTNACISHRETENWRSIRHFECIQQSNPTTSEKAIVYSEYTICRVTGLFRKTRNLLDLLVFFRSWGPFSSPQFAFEALVNSSIVILSRKEPTTQIHHKLLFEFAGVFCGAELF